MDSTLYNLFKLMPAERTNELLEETTRLKREIAELRQQLWAVNASGNAVKAGNIDALVFSDEKSFKVYTEKTTDKIYRILIEKMHEGAVLLTKEGTILYCNSYFSKMVESPLQKLIGTKFQTLVGFSDEKFYNLIKQDILDVVVKEEVNLNTNDGNAIPGLMSVSTLEFDGSYVLSVTLTDLTIHNKNRDELKRKARQLEQKNIELEIANKDLTSFTYVSSHDLQEPLRKIQIFVNCLLDEEKENLTAGGKNYLQRMYETAKRMRALIEDLLAYARTKNAECKFEKTDLGIILDEVRNDLKEEIVNKEATIEDAKFCSVSIIRYQFRQLLYNLISNSLKFSRSQTAPHIIITSEIVHGNKLINERLSSRKDYCHILYADNGIGFDPKYNDRIFEVFQRLHSQEEYSGTGIGLAICKRIIENHKGIISASGKINDGVRFDIYIPV